MANVKKYRFLVTSGGTREAIDGARFISNLSTGELGSLICGALAERSDCERVFYVCAGGAALPGTGKAEIVPVSDTASVIEAVKSVLRENDIDGIVHAMAVSDYRVKSVRTKDGAKLERAQKISSGENELVLTLEATPKIIALFPRLAPRAVLAGFKLLCGSTKETLLDAAAELLERNACAFVVANDKTSITATGHTAYLIDKNKNISEYRTKKEIARGVSEKMYSLLDGKRLE
jgi:phosphopantothenate-cysteine ligase